MKGDALPRIIRLVQGRPAPKKDWLRVADGLALSVSADVQGLQSTVRVVTQTDKDTPAQVATMIKEKLGSPSSKVHSDHRVMWV